MKCFVWNCTGPKFKMFPLLWSEEEGRKNQRNREGIKTKMETFCISRNFFWIEMKMFHNCIFFKQAKQNLNKI